MSEKEGCCGCYGPQGPQGIQGFQGPQGPAGQAGAAGAPGAVGAQGIQGVAGPQGPKGDLGPAGSQGPQGAAGKKGDTGAIGPQGPNGSVGAQGVQGIQGVPGKDCNPECCDKCYLSVYSIKDQTLSKNGSGTDIAKFEAVSVGTNTCLDWTKAATTGEVKILKSGVYKLEWLADGMLAPPFNSPVPSWGLALYKNGVVIPGTAIAGFSQSPDDDANCLTALLNVTCAAGDILTLRNISTFAIFLKAIHGELVVPMTSCSISALKVS